MKIILPLLALSATVCFASCVSTSKYKEAQSRLKQSETAQAALRQENAKMLAEIKRLEERNAHIKTLSDGFKEKADDLEKYMRSSKSAKNKMAQELINYKQTANEKLSLQEYELEGLRDQNRKLSEILESVMQSKKRYKKDDKRP